jgi:hypothetical protein
MPRHDGQMKRSEGETPRKRCQNVRIEKDQRGGESR